MRILKYYISPTVEVLELEPVNVLTASLSETLIDDGEAVDDPSDIL